MNRVFLASFTTFCLLSAVFLIGLSFNVQPVKASGTIYIRVDGSIDPPDAPISSFGNITYTLTGSINDSVVVERDNIILDGSGYTLQGTGFWLSTGIDISGRRQVTIQSVEIRNFGYGIVLEDSSNNTILGNNIANNSEGIRLSHGSSNNTIARNNITANNNVGVWLYSFNLTISGNNNTISGNNITSNEYGITLERSSDNTVAGNNMANNWYGVYLHYSSSNTMSGNNITANSGYGILPDSSSNNIILGNNITANNVDGIYLYGSSNNTILGNNITANNRYGINLVDSDNNNIYHNNFNNTHQTSSARSEENAWDNGYPSGGNYWSDYTGVDGDNDGIGDTSYVIEANNTDNYPLMTLYIIPEFPLFFILSLFMMATSLAVMVYTRKNKISDVM